MYKIVRKKELNAAVTYMEIEAPFVARKAKAGQFIIFRVDEKSERVPLTIAGYDREKGTVAIIFQKVGLSTEMLGSLNEGDYIQDFVGPLGKPTDVEGKKRVCVVGGSLDGQLAYLENDLLTTYAPYYYDTLLNDFENSEDGAYEAAYSLPSTASQAMVRSTTSWAESWTSPSRRYPTSGSTPTKTTRSCRERLKNRDLRDAGSFTFRMEHRGSRLSGAGNHDADERHRIDHLVLEVSFLHKQLLTIHI